MVTFGCPASMLSAPSGPSCRATLAPARVSTTVNARTIAIRYQMPFTTANKIGDTGDLLMLFTA